MSHNSTSTFLAHQATVRASAKAALVFGVASLVADTIGTAER